MTEEAYCAVDAATNRRSVDVGTRQLTQNSKTGSGLEEGRTFFILKLLHNSLINFKVWSIQIKFFTEGNKSQTKRGRKMNRT